ncbi:sulfide/dihydroorotate dehydrogenase-like FAD/NAD-binding protein [bacterium]|nr:sulfide/dihydroorotate dehydrogenase-like FAD/NAD-binding protein [bacterium]
MAKITRKEFLAQDIVLLEIEAKRIASNAQVGQFVVLMPYETSERIPISLHNWDQIRGTIQIVFQIVGRTTSELSTLDVGDYIYTLLGPLGKPLELAEYGKVVCVGGGLGIPPIYNIAKGLKEKGNEVISIIGARTASLLILEELIREASDELITCTDDGSYGRKGFVTEALRDLLNTTKIDLVIAIGPVPMMEAVANLTRPMGIKTIVSLNPIMLDATGMCGVCRVKVGGQIKFACVDGPKFDGHEVDFADLRRRLAMYKEEEAKALEEWKARI